MRTGLTKKQKTTNIYFTEADDLIEVCTYNTDLKKRLAAFAEKYPSECRQLDDDENGYYYLIPGVNISRINLLDHVAEFLTLPVGNNDIGQAFEFIKIPNNAAAEEGFFLQCRLVNHHFNAFGLDTLHDALDGALAEIIGVGLHG